MRFILGPILVIIGVLMMKYTVQLTDTWTGRIDFAEKYLGGGMAAGTYTWWRLVGLFFAVVGALWVFGLLNWVLRGIGFLFGIR